MTAPDGVGPGTAGGKLRAFWELGKPRLSALAVFAVVAGAYMGWPARSTHPPFDLLLATTVGTFLAAVGAAALNMYRERDLDPLMKRTQSRPLPSGRLTPREVLLFGLATSVAGVACVLTCAAPLAADGSRPPGQLNWTAGALSAAIVVSYVLVYTPMKVKTPLNTLVGAIPGALPPVVGHAAVVGELARPQAILFAILFCWQIPHFLAIAWRYREDYARAGMRMLPVVDPTGYRTALTMLLYVAGLGLASFLPYFTGMVDERYAAAAVLLDLLFFVPTVFAALTRRDAAMRMTFIVSIVYLPLLFVTMVLTRR
ncbi:MAG: protoheme IX farnesyltransferase [Planctomycetes bacterium]|nr:protoheme IX farnesyltransferase [Planctomycetota bacterium]